MANLRLRRTTRVERGDALSPIYLSDIQNENEGIDGFIIEDPLIDGENIIVDPEISAQRLGFYNPAELDEDYVQ